ncbi:hypothetical protein [Kitasatospora sp. MBT66]|uniref:hypothetical protein n=1 Tax=Kitasatospora sp. MBT66 TaxID=1444769 RepID=UPI0005BC09E2|nr:hypothetical protein [Kitasatospora sp. MBT66]
MTERRRVMLDLTRDDLTGALHCFRLGADQWDDLARDPAAPEYRRELAEVMADSARELAERLRRAWAEGFPVP